jgi:hypothetical protein
VKEEEIVEEQPKFTLIHGHPVRIIILFFMTVSQNRQPFKPVSNTDPTASQYKLRLCRKAKCNAVLIHKHHFTKLSKKSWKFSTLGAPRANASEPFWEV